MPARMTTGETYTATHTKQDGIVRIILDDGSRTYVLEECQVTPELLRLARYAARFTRTEQDTIVMDVLVQ